MGNCSRVVLSLGIAAALSAAATASPRANDDSEFVARGCIATTADLRGAEPRSMFVWSRGNIYIAYPESAEVPGTGYPGGPASALFRVFYWIDDEKDLARYVGQRVEVYGEIEDDSRVGEIEIDRHDGFAEIEFEVNGREAKALMPSAWLRFLTGDDDIEFDVPVRVVDIERVTVLGPCV